MILFNQGNSDFLECGTIIGGPCNGDTLWGIGIYEADDQEGCICKGFTASFALVRKIWIVGKCASRCSLGWSIGSWPTQPVNYQGLVTRSAQEATKLTEYH